MSQSILEKQKISKKAKHFNAGLLKKDFPILQKKINNMPLSYLDNAATSQKPLSVINAVSEYYQNYNANIHRGVHQLSVQATNAYEQARETVAKFINAQHTNEIIFVRGATEAINLVAQSYGRSLLQSGDEIIISEMEHHANIVPWQILAEQTGIKLKFIPINDKGELLIEHYEQQLTERTKLVSITHISNVLGTINPVVDMTQKAHQAGALVLLDGAQAVPHMGIDIQILDCDFYVFSGHKLFAPTGIGVLYGKQKILEKMPPYQGGGDMIKTVSLTKTTYNDLPYKFEAGTPNIAGAIGLGKAIDYLLSIGIENIYDYEHGLLQYTQEKLSTIPQLKIVGTAKKKSSILSFTLEGIHPHDIGTILDTQGIAIRTGHHCAMPIMEHFSIPATARASLTFYNTKGDIDRLVAGIQYAIQLLL